jgi:2-(1,2-epoxy-1,2-dihydrophenyl)acetyl-CoA isomerase
MKTVEYEIENGVAIITLNRPDRMNAINSDLAGDLTATVLRATHDDSAGCVVLTGAGRAFCAGGDIKEGAPARRIDAPDELADPTHENRIAWLRYGAEAARLLHEMGKPTIAVINGAVAGAGIGLAGACDVRFASQSATFVSAYDRIGASGDYGATWFWSKILGGGKVRELFLLGESFDSAKALAFGLFTRVFPDSALRDSSLTIAAKMAAASRTGWRYLKANLNAAEDGVFEQVLDLESANMILSTSATRAARRSQPELKDT